jgi:uncharacterized membrane protein
MRLITLGWLFLVVSACNNQANRDKVSADSIAQDTPIINSQPAHAADTVFTGFGNEPFWAVYVIDNSKIVFHPMEGGDVSVPFVPASQPDSVTTRYAGTTGSSEIVLIITKKPCSDGMSDITHQYAVELTVNKTNYSGCGRQM